MEGLDDVTHSVGNAFDEFNDWITDLFGRTLINFDPFVIDLNNDGVTLTTLSGSTAYFDLNGDGFAERTGWIAPSDGLLALDRNGNGRIDDISELFGSATQDGYAALRALDSNGDGRISGADARFGELLVWRDANSDGVSQAAELSPLAMHHVASIGLTSTASSDSQEGSVVTRRGTFTYLDGATGHTGAVQFGTDQVNTRFQLPEGFQYDPEVFALPNLRGYGRVPDLWVAMSMDAELKAMVQALVSRGQSLSDLDGVIGDAIDGTAFGGAWAWRGNDGPPLPAFIFDDFERMLARWSQVIDAPASHAFDIFTVPGVTYASLTPLYAWETNTVNQTLSAFLGRPIPGFTIFNPEFYEAFQQFSSNFAVRFYSQLPQIEGAAAFIAMSEAMRLNPPADGLSYTQAEVSALFDPIIADYDSRPPLGAAVQGLGDLRYDFRSDSIVGDPAGFIDQLFTGFDFNPSSPWQGYDAWANEHRFLVEAGGGEGLPLEAVYRRMSDNRALLVMREPNSDVNGTDGNDTLAGTAGVDLLTGGAGNDSLSGGAGSDTYLFRDGFGVDTVIDVSGERDEIAFQGGLVSTLARYAFAGANRQDLRITFEGRAESITVTGYFDPSGGATIERITFPDGPQASHREIRDGAFASLATEGADRLDGFVLGTTILGLGGNDRLEGSVNDDIFVGGTGNDWLQGAGGDDTYVFNLGDGQDSILASWHDDWVVMGSGITPAGVVVSQADYGEDIVLTIGTSGDRITLEGTMLAPWYRVEGVRFADGTVWTHTDLMARATAPTTAADVFYGGFEDDVLNGGAGDDRLVGRGGDDRLVGGAGNDLLVGESGNDVYVFNVGDGHDIINENWGNETVIFGPGITAANINVRQADTGGDIVIGYGNGDSVTFNESIPAAWCRVEYVRFADGTVLTHADLMALATTPTAGADVFYGDNGNDNLHGDAGNDQLVGRDGDDRLTGGTGNDRLTGQGGSDTYVFNLGDGQDIILDDNGTDAIEFGQGILAADVTVVQTDGGDDFLLRLNANGDSITLDVASAASWCRIETLRFADGTIWTHSDILARATAPTAGNDAFYGGSGDDILAGGAGNDLLVGREGNDRMTGGTGNDALRGQSGNDTYVFNLGDGQDIILDDGGIDVLEFGVGITAADVSVSYAGGGEDILLRLASGDSVTLDVSAIASWCRIEEVRFADGTVWTHSDLIAKASTNMTIYGTGGADTLVGGNGQDVFDAGLGNDLIKSGPGSDTFIYRRGDGNDTIEENSASLTDADTLRLVDLNPADVTLSRVADGSRLTVNSSGETIDIKWQFYDANFWGVEVIAFADGTTWDRARIQSESWIRGTVGADTLTGGAGNDVFDAGLGNDRVNSGAGSDTIHYSAGDGSDYIDDEAASRTDVDTLVLRNLNPSDVTFSRSGVHSTMLVNATGHVVTLDEQFYNADYWGLERISFADGTIWDRSRIQLESWFRGTSVADTLTGTASADTFTGGLGDDRINSGAGSDTIYYSSGDGSDYIDDEAGSRTDIDTLVLRDLNPADVSFSRQGVHSIMLVKATGHIVTLDEQFYNEDFWGLERISFADGTVWDRARIKLESKAPATQSQAMLFTEVGTTEAEATSSFGAVSNGLFLADISPSSGAYEYTLVTAPDVYQEQFIV